MKSARKYFWLCLSFCLIFTINPASASTKGLVISALDSPIPVKTRNKQLLVYELHITNTGDTPRRVNRIEVRDNKDKLLATYTAAKLQQNSMMYEQNKVIAPDKTIELHKNMGVLVYMWIALDKNEPAPVKLNHHIWSVSTNKDKSQAFVQKLTFDLPVKQELPAVLGNPLEGSNWVAVAAIGKHSYHRRSSLPFDGKFYVAQRFAVDWEQINTEGRESQGNMHENNHWKAFGQKILAVADGTIVNMTDNIAENTPPGLPNPPPPLAALLGNFIMLKTQQNNRDYYVMYAHMQPGSITVRKGDKVHKGQVLGLLGNTGNSGAPHLHIHVVDGKDALASSGLPFVFENLVLQGLAKEIDPDFGIYLPHWFKKPRKFANSTPSENDIVTFDAGKAKATA